ncbi:MAG: FAD-dependent oxidoreductase, partial [bacterium]|nr:FAD-dependent oxidoreductase [bacterium]
MRLVVIGGVAAGLSAASRARRVSRELEIVVLEKGETISYAACGLPYYVEGRVGSLDELRVYSPEYFSSERRIEVRTQAEVVRISHPRRELVLAGGERVSYDKLVIATGARPEVSAIQGRDQPHVFTLHTIGDARRLREYLRTNRPRRAVVVGAGYIGLEAVEALRANGLSVALLAADSTLLGRADATVAKAVTGQLKRFRVDYRPNTPVRKIEADGVGDVACEVVVLAPGLKPNVELVTDAGIEIGRTGAIRVSETMETNLTGVFAAGDCAEAMHLVTGRPSYVPLGTTANRMGRVAGACAAGARERFRGITGTSIVRVLGLGIGMTGLSSAEARAEGFDPIAASVDARDKPRYYQGRPTSVELVAERRTGRLLGGSVVGEEGVAGRVNVIATALGSQMRVDEFEQLDLAYAPPFAPVW